MLHFPLLRWGTPYKSLEVDTVVHFMSGEPLAQISQTNPGLITRDLRLADRARQSLREIPLKDLLEMAKKAASVFMHDELPAGDGLQTPEDFVLHQSATTGLPERLCRENMAKLHHVLTHLDQILESLTRKLDLEILTEGYGEEAGVLRSYQANSPVLGLVLPSNSPGVHGLWLPVVPLQIGLVLKPGPLEPWTPYRMAEAFFSSGIPREAISIYPGEADVGAAVVQNTPRSLLFGGTATVQQYWGNPSVQVHGPGFSKILLGDDQVDQWESHLEVLVESVLSNSGRSCVNCSSIWASRHTQEIADALAERLGPITGLPPTEEEAQLAAFTLPEQAQGIEEAIRAGLEESGVEDRTELQRPTESRLVLEERYGYLRPTVIHCDSPSRGMANSEYMFPFVTVVQCPQEQMLEKIGDTLVATAITSDADLRASLLDCTKIDRLNFGPIPTTRLNWLQPHEGNLIGFLFRERAFQME